MVVSFAESPIIPECRADAVAVDRAARAGDQAATVWLEGLFEPYRDRDIACFLCDASVPRAQPIYASIVGDLAEGEKCVAVPLCTDCGELPQMLKRRRVLDMLRAMYKTRPRH